MENLAFSQLDSQHKMFLGDLIFQTQNIFIDFLSENRLDSCLVKICLRSSVHNARCSNDYYNNRGLYEVLGQKGFTTRQVVNALAKCGFSNELEQVSVFDKLLSENNSLAPQILTKIFNLESISANPFREFPGIFAAQMNVAGVFDKIKPILNLVNMKYSTEEEQVDIVKDSRFVVFLERAVFDNQDLYRSLQKLGMPQFPSVTDEEVKKAYNFLLYGLEPHQALRASYDLPFHVSQLAFENYCIDNFSKLEILTPNFSPTRELIQNSTEIKLKFMSLVREAWSSGRLLRTLEKLNPVNRHYGNVDMPFILPMTAEEYLNPPMQNVFYNLIPTESFIEMWLKTVFPDKVNDPRFQSFITKIIENELDQQLLADFIREVGYKQFATDFDIPLAWALKIVKQE